MPTTILSKCKELGGFPVIVMDDLRDKHPEMFTESGAMDWKLFEKEMRPNNFIYVRKDKNSIAFTLQTGPVNEVGINGCQMDSLIEAVKVVIQGFNNRFPCRENAMTITKLDEALMWQRKRTEDREARGVEGTNKS